MASHPVHSRRNVLKTGVAGGALLALAGAGFLASRKSRLLDVPQELKVFDALEYSVLFALARRIVAPPPSWPSLDTVNPVVNADATLALAPEVVLKDIKRLVRLFDNSLASFVLDGWTRPFTALNDAEQDAALAQWRDSRWVLRRTGFVVLRTLLAAAYYGDPHTWQAVGYPGPPEGYHRPDAPVWKGGDVPRPPLGTEDLP